MVGVCKDGCGSAGRTGRALIREKVVLYVTPPEHVGNILEQETLLRLAPVFRTGPCMLEV